MTYVGHSQGTTQMFYALTQMEEEFLESRVNLFVALAPVVRLKNCKDDGLKMAAKSLSFFEKKIKDYHMHEFFGPEWKLF